MEVQYLELRDHGTFIPVICIRPVAANEAQRYLLRRDGYRADDSEHCIIMIDAQCRGVAYDSYDWHGRWPNGTQSQTWMRGLYQIPRYPSQMGSPRVQ